MAQTKAIYYRDRRGVEPVNRFIDGLPAKRAAKIDDQRSGNLIVLLHAVEKDTGAYFIYLDKLPIHERKCQRSNQPEGEVCRRDGTEPRAA